MVTPQISSAPIYKPLPVYISGLMLLILSSGFSYLLTSFLTPLSPLSRIGLSLLTPALLLTISAYLLAHLAQKALWSLLLTGQALGLIAIFILMLGLL